MFNRKSNNGLSEQITLHVGCELGYATERLAPVVLLLHPHRMKNQILLRHEFSSSSCHAVKEYIDSHGNRMLRTILAPGDTILRQDAILVVSGLPDDSPENVPATPVEKLPLNVLRYTFPSRYCESDKLQSMAVAIFGHLDQGSEQVEAIATWVHQHIEYRYGSGSALQSAVDVLQHGYGVCRDFAHVMISFCRALDMPARYVAGHVPLLPGNETVGQNDMGTDFHAYCEVFLGGRWHTYDPRYNKRLKGRVKIAHGMDAVDAAFSTTYGNVSITQFKVWSHQIEELPACRSRGPTAEPESSRSMKEANV